MCKNFFVLGRTGVGEKFHHLNTDCEAMNWHFNVTSLWNGSRQWNGQALFPGSMHAL